MQASNQAVVAELEPYQTVVWLCGAQELEVEADLDELWSYVQSKQPQRWLWLAIDHRTSKGLAYGLASHEEQAFLDRKAVLEPLGILQFYPDGWGAYERHLEPALHPVGNRHTERIERKHLSLRTRIQRLVRKTICFSKSVLMHDVVIGLLINRLQFGLPV